MPRKSAPVEEDSFGKETAQKILHPPWDRDAKIAILENARTQGEAGIGFRSTYRILAKDSKTRVGSFTTLKSILGGFVGQGYLQLVQGVRPSYRITPNGIEQLRLLKSEKRWRRDLLELMTDPAARAVHFGNLELARQTPRPDGWTEKLLVIWVPPKTDKRKVEQLRRALKVIEPHLAIVQTHRPEEDYIWKGIIRSREAPREPDEDADFLKPLREKYKMD